MTVHERLMRSAWVLSLEPECRRTDGPPPGMKTWDPLEFCATPWPLLPESGGEVPRFVQVIEGKALSPPRVHPSLSLTVPWRAKR
jgi:hypothetical protein